MSSHSTDPLPSSGDLAKAKSCTLVDGEGKEHAFGSLLSTSPDATDIILFVRHYHCGACLSFLQSFFSHPEAQSYNVVVIGHGDRTLIPTYVQKVQSGVKDGASPPSIRVYSDPTKSLYHSLGFTRRNLKLGEKTPEYYGEGKGHTGMVLGSIVDMVKSGPSAIWKSGDFAQLGGEVVIKGNEVLYAHYMETTTDHTEVAELLRRAGESHEEK